jgi:hypothetical protein
MPAQLLRRLEIALQGVKASASAAVRATSAAAGGLLRAFSWTGYQLIGMLEERLSPLLAAHLQSLRHAELLERLDQLWKRLLVVLREAGRLTLATSVAGWSVVRGPLIAALQITAALVVLFEEWGWRPLVALLASLTRFELWAQLELWIAGLPPYGALVALALPTSILFPLKIVSVLLLTQGYWLTAAALFVAAKIVSTALIARIFILAKPALMQIGWFATSFDRFVHWQTIVFTQIRSSWIWRYARMVKTRIRLEARRAWARLEPWLIAAWAEWRARLDEAWHATQLWATEASTRLRILVAFEAARFRIAVRHMWERMIGA